MRSGGVASKIGPRVAGSVLCLAVAAIHLIDQAGVPGSKTPQYVAIGYWVLEIVAVLTAAVLLAGWPAARAAWFVGIGVGACPLVGYVLSRGPGLPDYSDDIGNWTEPLGLISLAVEAVLIILAVTIFVRSRSPRVGGQGAPGRAPLRDPAG